MIYVLDACAMIAYLNNEPGADVVEAALIDPANQCCAHGINLCEVFYQFHRAGGESAAIGAISDLHSMNMIERSDFDQAFWLDTGRLKANGGVSLADCFAVTLTNRLGGVLLTSDHHEMDKIAAAGICNITFIR
jgi:PIN domain nuclease of toxin-antitoxin system